MMGQARRVGLLLVQVFCLFGAVGLSHAADSDSGKSADAELPLPKTWHVSAYVRGDIGLRVIDYWSKGGSMRARTLIHGRPVTTIVHNGRYIVYEDLTGQGLDIARSPAATKEDRGRMRPFAFELDELRRDGGEKIDEVRLGNIDAEIWQLTDGQGRRKIWIAKAASGVPVRVQLFDRKTGATIETDYSGWVFDLEIGDRFFAPRNDLKLQRFDYEAYLKKSLQGSVSPVPILYPDLLHGSPPS